MMEANLVTRASFIPDPKSRLTKLAADARLTGTSSNGAGGAPEQGSLHAAPSAAGGLSLSVLRTLARNSITTVEELLGLEHVDRRFSTALLADLGVSRSAAESIRSAYVRTERGLSEIRDWGRFDRFEYALGCELGDSPEAFGSGEQVGTTPAEDAGGEGVNLSLACLSGVRDQEDRATCTAFATVACLEHHICRTMGIAERLSEQFQYWNMIERSGRRSLVASFPLLKTDGVCRASTWPYHGTEIAGNDGQGPPPPAAAAEAGAHRCGDVLQLAPRSVPAIRQALRDDRLVAIGFPVYRSWLDNPVVRKYGNITLPLPGEVPETMGHAVVLVGFADDADFAGGGFFIVRNSWNHRWGTSSVFGSGHGTIPYAYIQRLNWDAWCITR
jgi:hypothetical protein